MRSVTTTTSRRTVVMREKKFTAANGYEYRVQVNDEDAEAYGLKPAKKATTTRGPEPEKKDEEPAGETRPARPGAARRREK
jgi:hypothetical protein